MNLNLKSDSTVIEVSRSTQLFLNKVMMGVRQVYLPLKLTMIMTQLLPIISAKKHVVIGLMQACSKQISWPKRIQSSKLNDEKESSSLNLHLLHLHL